jgi:hypothetical protein
MGGRMRRTIQSRRLLRSVSHESTQNFSVVGAPARSWKRPNGGGGDAWRTRGH